MVRQKSNLAVKLTYLLAVGLILFSATTSAGELADHIFLNGQIVTVDKNFTIASALAIKNGKILAVGTDAQVLEFKGPESAVTDLKGNMVLPGLIDSHQHTLSAAVSEFQHPIPAMRTVADVVAYIKARAKVVPKGEWIWVRNVFPTRLREHRFPTRAELDSAAPAHPVIFAAFGISPLASLNTMALTTLGIDKDLIAENPGDILKHPQTGEPTGLIKNHRRYIDDVGTPDITDDRQRQRQYINMMQIYNSVGLTTVVDRNTSAKVADFYKTMAERNLSTVRISLFHALDTHTNIPIERIEREIQRIANLPLHTEQHPMVQLIGVKTFADGGILSGSAYMLEPWGKSTIHAITDDSYRGKLFIQPQRLTQLIRASVAAGLQFTAHAVGDGAVTEVVKAYDRVNQSLPIKGSRASVTHSNFVSPWVIGKMAEMDIIADIQPAWFYLDSTALIKQFGDDRLRYFQPLSSLYDAGVVVAGGSDHWSMEESFDAVNPFNPFMGMWVTISRNARYVEKKVHPQEALTRRQALAMYSINAAYALSREQDIGSLEVDKLADFIVIDRNILTCDVDAIRDTQVLQTYLDGKLVWGQVLNRAHGSRPDPAQTPLTQTKMQKQHQ